MLDIAGTWLTAEDRQLLRQPEVGGLILFGRNIECPRQVRELAAAVRALPSAARIPAASVPPAACPNPLRAGSVS